VRRTWKEINRKIDEGRVVVVTAEEMTQLTAEAGPEEAFRRVDVVTTGTFGPMCGSGLLLNTGHNRPRLNYREASLNDVPAYAGLAAVDHYLGATARSTSAPRYGGGHVIEELASGRAATLRARGHGTDCYPGLAVEKELRLADLGDAVLLNPRNCYQNYNVAVNASSPRTVHTYMGPLLPGMANVAYSSAGVLSPLLNDPEYRTLGIGSRVFLGGGTGYVAFPGTQHSPDGPRSPEGVPLEGAGTLGLAGDLRGMSPGYLRGAWIQGYGVSLAVGVGTAITVDLVDRKGRFVGGAIAPGLTMSLQALNHYTACLPLVESRKSTRAVEPNTESAMQSGVYWMCRGGLDRLVGQIRAEAEDWEAAVVVTGGEADLLLPLSTGSPLHWEPELIFSGIWKALESHESSDPGKDVVTSPPIASPNDPQATRTLPASKSLTVSTFKPSEPTLIR